MTRRTGTTTRTHSVTTTRIHHLSWATRGSPHRVRPEGAEDGPDPREQVRHAGQVGQDVVSVEADQGQELPEHLDDLGRNDQQERIPAADPPDGSDRHGDDRIEVQPAEVRAQPSRTAEAVGVGHVGVERRPEQVQAAAHDAGLRTATSRRGRVAELVEPGRKDRDGDHEQQELGLGECLVGR